MPKSIAYAHTHIIFSTKNREPFINDEISERLFSYIGSVCHMNGCQPLQVGGWRDHVHILCAPSRIITIADLLRTIKTDSHHWFSHHDAGNPDFAWQTGYAALSVTPKYSHNVIRYIADQRAHHQGLGYQDECRQIFRDQGLELDDRYFWDLGYAFPGFPPGADRKRACSAFQQRAL